MQGKMDQTVAAISTAQAPGGIGVIRVSGPQAPQICDRVFRGVGGKQDVLQNAAGYTAHYGGVYSQQSEKLDECVALRFCAPHSFTGEDVVELSCHGGLYILKQVLRAVLAAGAVPAGPGEFTKRAFLNGKTDLAQAEAVMELIHAGGEQSARAAICAKDGALSVKIGQIKARLVELDAHLSAWADFPDDDIPQISDELLNTGLCFARQALQQLLQTFDTGRVLREGVVTVIAGRPNAGKSTLMNLLSGCERSIVTAVAGTTRDVVEESVLLGDIPLLLADTAGIRRTDDEVEQIGVERALQRLQSAQLVLAVFDASQQLGEDDFYLLQHLQQVPVVAVINKTDLPVCVDEAVLRERFPFLAHISARSGEGLQELQTAAAAALHMAKIDPCAGILYTERQRKDCLRALEGVNEAYEAFKSGVTLDGVTVSVEYAIDALCELTGEKVSDTVVDAVFEKFCVGK